VTVHAGEVPGSKDLEAALALGADRLGHATLLSRHPALLREVRRRRIPIEVNLTSNLRTSAVADLRRHPARRWRQLGIPLAVSTDDPGVFGVDLSHEYRLLRDELAFRADDLVAVSLQAVDALFLPEVERRALRRSFEEELLDLLGRLAGGEDAPPSPGGAR
jgi:adenosine deaminase